VVNLHTLKARYVFPGSGQPIAGGAVTIAGERIAAVGQPSDRGAGEDLGNVAVLPGLVNAHTHLEFGDLAEPLGHRGIARVDWIRRLMAMRQRSADRRLPVRDGLAESARQGVALLGEIAQPGWSAEPFAAAELDAVVFQELIAPTADCVAAAVQLAEEHLGTPMPPGVRPGLGPHAPYTVHDDLLAAAVDLSAAHRAPLAMHLAESREELQLLRSGEGPLAELLAERGRWEPARFRPGTRPLDYLKRLAQAHRVLVIHGNYLDEEEIAFLGRHRDRMTVVYCPRTHQWFGHKLYPLGQLLAAGVTVALGTDSRASAPDLSILAEMRAAARAHPDVEPATILHMATLAGARALGRFGDLGSLEPGKRADLTAVALPDRETSNPYELLLEADTPVVARWYRGSRDAP